MKYNQNHLSLAVRLALSVGFMTTAGVVQAQQQTGSDTSTTSSTTSTTTTTQTPAKPEASKAKTLNAVVVTGSLIRRVDLETASPVVTLDRTNILNSGKPTLGDVLQQLPSVSGNATNPSNNSNGGGGASPTLEAATAPRASRCAAWAKIAPWC
jgi:outer membrane cobalamin receptor